MSLIVYTKIGCGWCEELIDFLKDNDVSFEEKVIKREDVLARPERDGARRGQKIFQQKNICDVRNHNYFDEMIKISGQTFAPTVILDEVVYPDTDKEEIKKILKL